ncbi:hypothetical protein [Amycolatopsis sp. BJA-103]|uniref:hypothetical protein n=1 Tax=Amycolatopsis sp. BJA-103 TaxID=1911175 RepID=UPI0011AFA14B|nr:hypothetical protein [Amycolatopsis sp. BJA-103]
MLDSLGDVETALNSRNPDRITQVYRDLGLQVLYDNKRGGRGDRLSPCGQRVCPRGMPSLAAQQSRVRRVLELLAFANGLVCVDK